MIANDCQLQTMLNRSAWFQEQVVHLRKTEPNPVNYRAAASGFLAETDRMQLEVREYLRMHPTELEAHPSTPSQQQPATAASG